MKERVRTLESDLEGALRDKTDLACDNRRLSAQVENLEREMKEMRVQNMT